MCPIYDLFNLEDKVLILWSLLNAGSNWGALDRDTGMAFRLDLITDKIGTNQVEFKLDTQKKRSGLKL